MANSLRLPDLQEFISLSQGARLSGVTSQTLRNWADSGAVRAIRDPAGRRLLHRADLERWLVERRARRLTSERS